MEEDGYVRLALAIDEVRAAAGGDRVRGREGAETLEIDVARERWRGALRL